MLTKYMAFQFAKDWSRAASDPGFYTPRADNYTEAMGHWIRRAQAIVEATYFAAPIPAATAQWRDIRWDYHRGPEFARTPGDEYREKYGHPREWKPIGPGITELYTSTDFQHNEYRRLIPPLDDVKCNACYGSGIVGDMSGIDKGVPCPECNGTGNVPPLDATLAPSEPETATQRMERSLGIMPRAATAAGETADDAPSGFKRLLTRRIHFATEGSGILSWEDYQDIVDYVNNLRQLIAQPADAGTEDGALLDWIESNGYHLYHQSLSERWVVENSRFTLGKGPTLRNAIRAARKGAL